MKNFYFSLLVLASFLILIEKVTKPNKQGELPEIMDRQRKESVKTPSRLNTYKEDTEKRENEPLSYNSIYH